MKNLEGSFHAKEHQFAIITARFNDFITNKLHAGALDCLYRHGISPEQVTSAWVPGAFEIPLIAKKLAKTNIYSGIICLGAVIRGETPHFDYVCSEAAKGIASVSLTTEMPIIFGVITTNTVEQAIMRAGVKSDNKGWQAALAALEMCNLVDEISNFSHILPIKSKEKYVQSSA